MTTTIIADFFGALVRLDPSERLRVLALLPPPMDAALRTTVAELRSTGTTWEAIGDLLGISKQAAQQRFGE